MSQDYKTMLNLPLTMYSLSIMGVFEIHPISLIFVSLL